MNRNVIWATVVIIICHSSCNVKDLESPRDNLKNEMKADLNFSWSTTKQVTIEIKGLQLPVPILRKLTLSTGEDGVFYSGTQLMNENFNYSVELPNHIHSISMQFGEIMKTREVTENKISFDYLPADLDNESVE